MVLTTTGAKCAYCFVELGCEASLRRWVTKWSVDSLHREPHRLRPAGFSPGDVYFRDIRTAQKYVHRRTLIPARLPPVASICAALSRPGASRREAAGRNFRTEDLGPTRRFSVLSAAQGERHPPPTGSGPPPAARTAAWAAAAAAAARSDDCISGAGACGGALRIGSGRAVCDAPRTGEDGRRER